MTPPAPAKYPGSSSETLLRSTYPGDLGHLVDRRGDGAAARLILDHLRGQEILRTLHRREHLIYTVHKYFTGLSSQKFSQLYRQCYASIYFEIGSGPRILAQFGFGTRVMQVYVINF